MAKAWSSAAPAPLLRFGPGSSHSNNQQNGKSAGFIQPQIYAANAASAFNDIVSGNNGAFSAGPGWDACTGLGSPIGTKLIALLGASTAHQEKGWREETGPHAAG